MEDCHHACFPFEKQRSRGLDRRPGHRQQYVNNSRNWAFQQSYWLLRCHGPIKVPVPLQCGTSVAAYRSVHGSDSAPQSSPSVTAAQRGSDAVAASLLSQAARRKQRFYTEQNSKAAYRSYLRVSCAEFFFFHFLPTQI